MSGIDIHNFSRQYATAEIALRESALSARNKALILAYRDACFVHQVCGIVRVTRAFTVLRLLGLRLNKDYDQVTREDLVRLVGDLTRSGLKPTSLGSYKAILKRFMGFVLRPNEFPHLEQQPPEIAWLHSHVRKRDYPRLQRSDLLTPEEIERMVCAGQTARDKAYLALSWELGARVGELGNLQVKHAAPHQHGYMVDLRGKTGVRNVIVVYAAPYLAQWLAVHPYAENPDAPMWPRERETTPVPVGYAGLLRILWRALHRAGIRKRVYPHLFRHSRPTYCIANNYMNEQQAKAYFGWARDSDMLANYEHLTAQDANNAVLREHNLQPALERCQTLTAQVCPRCATMNPNTATCCTKCTSLLNHRAAHEAAVRETQTHELLLRMYKVLVDKGLLDDAADEVHDAGLGQTLKRLATHPGTRAH